MRTTIVPCVAAQPHNGALCGGGGYSGSLPSTDCDGRTVVKWHRPFAAEH
jgi:hypothetical protein